MTRDEGAAIYVLVDALGWEILRERPFLNDVLTERYCLETILGYSSGAIPTLVTGQPPAVHGRWNLFYRSPETSPFRWTRPLLEISARNWTRLLHLRTSLPNPPVLLDLEIETGGLGQEEHSLPVGGTRA